MGGTRQRAAQEDFGVSQNVWRPPNQSKEGNVVERSESGLMRHLHGAVYIVMQDGSWKRLSPKPPNKKERKKLQAVKSGEEADGNDSQ